MTDTKRDVGLEFLPKFDASGLITAVVSEAQTGEPLMVAHMNEEALRKSVATGEAHFWSRSRQELWRKGATSGNVLTIHEIRIDCDQDAVWLAVHIAGDGAACHTGRKSCFYRKIEAGIGGAIELAETQDAVFSDPETV